MLTNLKVVDVFAVTFIVAGFVVVADLKSQRPNEWMWLQGDMSDHLGAEYNNIAKSLVDGKGFSNPFQIQTGATAWMPPVLPVGLAAIHWFFPDPSIARLLMFVLSAVAAWFTGLIVVDQAIELRIRILGHLTFSVGLAANFHEIFQKTHDPGLLLILVNSMYLGSLVIDKASGRRSILLWGCFGGFCALCSPVLGATWALFCIYRFWPFEKCADGLRIANCRFRVANSKAGRLLLVALVAIVVVLPWTIRNRLTLGVWIPIKSNGMYELWQSQCADDDGVIDLRTFSEHPWSVYSPQLTRIKEVGEIRFISEKGDEAIDSIRQSPLIFGRRVANRAAAATVWYPAFSEYQLERGGGWPIFLKRIVFPIPFLSIVLLLLCGLSKGDSRRFHSIIMIYCGILGPYILISYYERYAIPLLAMKLMLVLFGASCLAAKCSRLLKELGAPRGQLDVSSSGSDLGHNEA